MFQHEKSRTETAGDRTPPKIDQGIGFRFFLQKMKRLPLLCNPLKL